MDLPRLVIAMLAALPLGCGAHNNTGNPAPLDAGDVPATDTPATDTPVGTAQCPSVPNPATGYYLPAGTALAPFLSATPVRSFAAADMVLEAHCDYLAVLVTDAGRIVIDLTETQTPITVNSFVFLAQNHFFDGIAFHRVIDGFVAQGGDPNTLSADRSTWGTGGPGYEFGLEVVPTLNFDGAGVVGMARGTDPGSNGSQFFITLAAAPSLDQMYTVFGNVTEGASTLPLIARNATATTPPVTPTRMTSVYIVERPGP